MRFNKGDLIRYKLIHYADNTYPIGIITRADNTGLDVKWFPDTIKASETFIPPTIFGRLTNALSIVAKA